MQYSAALENTIFTHREVLDPLVPHYSIPDPHISLFRRAAEALNPITCEGIYTLQLQLLANHLHLHFVHTEYKLLGA